METCQIVVAYEREVPGSDVADPRIRCGQPATVPRDDGTWVCPEHAEEARRERGAEPVQPDRQRRDVRDV